ncbi:MAG: hypothetical protein KBF93_11790 [Leptospiraceae bacterium]|nr:hypothetical protein [Leptospiraceae bacterium]
MTKHKLNDIVLMYHRGCLEKCRILKINTLIGYTSKGTEVNQVIYTVENIKKRFATDLYEREIFVSVDDFLKSIKPIFLDFNLDENTDYTESHVKSLLDDSNISKFFEIAKELEKAKKYPPFSSLHEGYAVLKEEVEEFWDLVKGYKYNESWEESEDLKKIEKELIQIAAMAVKNLQLVDSMKAKIQGKIL